MVEGGCFGALPPGAMPRKKISTTVYLRPEQNERLKRLHEATKVPVAVYIREGIDLVLDKYRHLLPGEQLDLDALLHPRVPEMRRAGQPPLPWPEASDDEGA